MLSHLFLHKIVISEVFLSYYLYLFLSHNDNAHVQRRGQFGNFVISCAQRLVVKILKEDTKKVGENYDVGVH